MTTKTLFNCGVYRWLNMVTGKSYVGSSAHISQRKRGHITRLTSNRHDNIKLQRAWNKYGASSFEFEMLTFCEEKDLLWQEQLAINAFDAVACGYNISPMSSSPMRGRKHSDKTKLLMSVSHTGQLHTEESKLAISKAKQGVLFSSDHKLRLSQSKQGNKQSIEHKTNVINARIKGIEKFSRGCQEAAWRLTPEYRAWRGRRAAAGRWGSIFTEPAPTRKVESC